MANMTSLIRALSESFQYVTAISGAGKELPMCSLQLKQIKESVNVNANVNIFDDVNVSVGVAFFFCIYQLIYPPPHGKMSGVHLLENVGVSDHCLLLKVADKPALSILKA